MTDNTSVLCAYSVTHPSMDHIRATSNRGMKKFLVHHIGSTILEYVFCQSVKVKDVSFRLG